MTLCLYTGKQCGCQPQDGVACQHIPRFDIELGGYGRDSIAHISKPDGEWVRWREVERVILDPLRRCPADGVAVGVGLQHLSEHDRNVMGVALYRLEHDDKAAGSTRDRAKVLRAALNADGVMGTQGDKA